jgi:hypothetical protein
MNRRTYSCLQNPSHNFFFSYMLFDRCELHTQWPKLTAWRREVVHVPNLAWTRGLTLLRTFSLSISTYQHP